LDFTTHVKRSKCRFRKFETVRPTVITRVIIPQNEVRKWSSSQSGSHQVSPPPCGPSSGMGNHESDGLDSRPGTPVLEYQDDEEEQEEDEELVRDLTGGGALAAVQPPAASAVPGLRNAPRECAIRMPCIRVLVGGCCRGRAYVSSWEAAAEAVAHFVSR